jgi:hypothetical protein
MSFSGSMVHVDLADVIQMCCLAALDGALQVIHDDFIGHIFMREGQIIHADACSKKGEDAFYFLLSLREGAFEFRKEVPCPEETITAHWEYLLIEGSRRKEQESLSEVVAEGVRTIKLEDMLQMCCLAGLNGDLQLIYNDTVGHIFIREGQVVHADFDLHKGEEAFYQLISLRHSPFEFVKDVDSPEETIFSQWEPLLAEARRRQTEHNVSRGLSGTLAEVKLSDILQMCCLGGMSGDLSIAHGATDAHIFLSKGQIIHAEVSGQSGEEAFYQLLSLREGSFEFHRDVPCPGQSIHEQWEYLLIEGSRQDDEHAPGDRDGIRALALQPPCDHFMPAAVCAHYGEQAPGLCRRSQRPHEADEPTRRSRLWQCLSAVKGFLGAAVCDADGQVMAHHREMPGGHIIDLAMQCETFRKSVEQSRSRQGQAPAKYNILHMATKVVVDFRCHRQHILIVIARENMSELMLVNLLKTLRELGFLREFMRSRR